MDKTSCHCPLFFPSSFLEQSFLWGRNQLSEFPVSSALFALPEFLSWSFTWLYSAIGFMPSTTCSFSTECRGELKYHHSLSSNTDHWRWKLCPCIFTIILPGSVHFVEWSPFHHNFDECVFISFSLVVTVVHITRAGFRASPIAPLFFHNVHHLAQSNKT